VSGGDVQAFQKARLQHSCYSISTDVLVPSGAGAPSCSVAGSAEESLPFRASGHRTTSFVPSPGYVAASRVPPRKAICPSVSRSLTRWTDGSRPLPLSRTETCRHPSCRAAQTSTRPLGAWPAA
jgi:hypothetical protein